MMRFIKNVFIFIVAAGVIVALLKMFGGDPFAVLEWAWSWVISFIDRISDWLSGNYYFQKAASSPA